MVIVVYDVYFSSTSYSFFISLLLGKFLDKIRQTEQHRLQFFVSQIRTVQTPLAEDLLRVTYPVQDGPKLICDAMQGVH
jgi:hypothetical protein